MKGLPPEKQAEMMQRMGKDYGAEMGMLDKQMGGAEDLMNTATPEGRTTRNQIYTAANPLEHLGAGAQRYAGYKQMGDLRSSQEELMKDKQSMMSDIMRGIGGL